jgi:hypothetical protein
VVGAALIDVGTNPLPATIHIDGDTVILHVLRCPLAEMELDFFFSERASKLEICQLGSHVAEATRTLRGVTGRTLLSSRASLPEFFIDGKYHFTLRTLFPLLHLRTPTSEAEHELLESALSAFQVTDETLALAAAFVFKKAVVYFDRAETPAETVQPTNKTVMLAHASSAVVARIASQIAGVHIEKPETDLLPFGDASLRSPDSVSALLAAAVAAGPFFMHTHAISEFPTVLFAPESSPAALSALASAGSTDPLVALSATLAPTCSILIVRADSNHKLQTVTLASKTSQKAIRFDEAVRVLATSWAATVIVTPDGFSIARSSTRPHVRLRVDTLTGVSQETNLDVDADTASLKRAFGILQELKKQRLA